MFLAIDGDNIGLEIERFIFLCQPELLIQYWKNVSNIVSKIEKKLSSLGAKILLCGGDSILAELDQYLSPKAVHELFSYTFPLSFSVGSGNTMLEAYIALKTAKASGKRCWIDYNDLSSVLQL